MIICNHLQYPELTCRRRKSKISLACQNDFFPIRKIILSRSNFRLQLHCDKGKANNIDMQMEINPRINPSHHSSLPPDPWLLALLRSPPSGEHVLENQCIGLPSNDNKIKEKGMSALAFIPKHIINY